MPSKLKKFKEKLATVDPVFLSRLLFGVVSFFALFFLCTTLYYHGIVEKVRPSAGVLAAEMKKNPLSLLDAVGELMLLPKNEDPVIATITDSTLLNNEAFKDAKNGDKVIVFPQSKVAIVYRPSANKIIWAGPGIYQSPNAIPTVTATDSAQAATPQQLVLPGQASTHGKVLVSEPTPQPTEIPPAFLTPQANPTSSTSNAPGIPLEKH